MSAQDEIELFVAVLAHELEHARAYHVTRNLGWVDRKKQRQRLNSEPRVRAIDYRVLNAFRSDRDRLVMAWRSSIIKTVVTEKPDPKEAAREKKARRASELLKIWERKSKLAKNKVAKYQRLVTRLNKVVERAVAAKKGG